MENKRFDNIGENLYTAKLPDGLTLNVAAKPGYATSFAAFAANYGGAMGALLWRFLKVQG